MKKPFIKNQEGKTEDRSELSKETKGKTEGGMEPYNRDKGENRR